MIYLQRTREPIERDQSAIPIERAYMRKKTRFHVVAFKATTYAALNTHISNRVATWPAWCSDRPRRGCKTATLNGWRQPVEWLPDAGNKI